MERAKIKILVAEDELIIARWLKMELELLDYEVCALVSSGEEAITSAVKFEPDVILMDVYLNGELSGLETARMIQKKNDCKIIFMTGYNKANLETEITGIDPEIVLMKPINPTDLKEIIDSF
jgi:CheY-like chemotaxis protein